MLPKASKVSKLSLLKCTATVFSLEKQSSNCNQHHPFMKYPPVVGLKCIRERTDKLTACQREWYRSIPEQWKFPQDKAKPQAKVTTVHGHPNKHGPCLKKAKEKLWSLGASQVESVISQAKRAGSRSLQESKARTGIAQHPTAPVNADTEPPSPVTAQGQSLLCSTGISLLTPETGPQLCF